MGLYAPDAPEPRDYGEETRDTLEAQIDLAPDLYEAEANPDYGRAAYAELDMQILRDTLMGKDGQPGLLDLYDETLPQLSEAEGFARRAGVEQDVGIVEDFGPRVTEAFKAANPEQAALMEALNAQAMEGLDAGASLPPDLAREVQQSIRGAQAARGFGYGIGDISQEALFSGQTAEALQRRRQQFAQSVAAQQAATYGDPFLALLGRPGVQTSHGAGVAAQAGAMNPGAIFNPESGYAGSIYAGNANAAANNAMMKVNNRMAGLTSFLMPLANSGGQAISNAWGGDGGGGGGGGQGFGSWTGNTRSGGGGGGGLGIISSII